MYGVLYNEYPSNPFLHSMVVPLHPAASPSICTNLHTSIYICKVPEPEPHLPRTPCHSLPCLSVMCRWPWGRRKISTKHAREPPSLTLSPSCRVYSIFYYYVLGALCSALTFILHALHAGTACAAYTAWTGCQGRSFRRVSENDNRQWQRWSLCLAIIVRLHHFPRYYTLLTNAGGHKTQSTGQNAILTT